MEKPERNHRGSMQERRFLLPISLLALVMATVALINASKAEEPSPAHKITDGRPWKMTTDDGRVGTLVLFQNGTGKMTGGDSWTCPRTGGRPRMDYALNPGHCFPNDA